jgi:uncharacterized Zn finger protein
MAEAPTEAGAPGPPARGAVRLSTVSLWCETCGRETPHRVVRLRGGAPGPGGRVAGVARCRECRWTHPFESAPSPEVEVSLLVSDGERTESTTVRLPPTRRLALGETFPGPAGPVTIRKLDPRSGPPVRAAPASEVATVWATRGTGAVVRVSVVEGSRTRPARLVAPPDRTLSVGDRMTVDGVPILVVGLRARGHTWRREGDGFPAAEVQRLYGRRTDRPPAGRSDWSSGRGTPRSRESSTSRFDRSRSSPGVRKARTRPWARTADSGATVHRSADS